MAGPSRGEGAPHFQLGKLRPRKAGDWKATTLGGNTRSPSSQDTLVQGSTDLTIWSWRLRPWRERWTSSQERPWSRRLGVGARGHVWAMGPEVCIPYPVQAGDYGL